MRQGPFKYNLKDKALREYTTEYYNWIASFSKVNEVFYKHETNSIGLFADITASSENSSDSRWDDQSAVKAVDGIADGYATGLANLHTRFPWAEWVTKNEGAGAWLNLAFNEEYKVSTIKLYDRPNTDDQITASHLELDDGTRIEVGELPNDGSVKIINLGEEKVVKNIKFVVDKVSDLILIGQTAGKIFDKVKEESERQGKNIAISMCDTLQEAVDIAKKTARKGDVVLFSPASASFDMFKDFADRGRKFKKMVNDL